MDIKLKGRKFSLQVILIFLTVCIGVAIGACIAIKNDLFKNKYYSDDVHYEFGKVLRDVKELMLYTDGLYGDLREESIKAEVSNIKNTSNNFVDDEEIEKSVVSNFNNRVLEIRNELSRYVNIEFYFKMNDGRKAFTNVNVESNEEFEEDTLENYSDYIIIKSNRDVKVSKRLETVNGYLKSLRFNDDKYLIDYSNDIYIRVAEPLKNGDVIYRDVTTYTRWRTYGYISIVLLVMSVVGIIYSIKKLKEKDFSFIEKGRIAKVLSQIDIEVKLFFVLVILNNRINIFRGTIYHWIIIKSVFIILIPIYLFIVDYFRIKSTYHKSILKNLIQKETLVKKIKDLFVEGGLFIGLLFILTSIAIWYISISMFIISGMEGYLKFNYNYNYLGTTIIGITNTMFCDGIIIRHFNSIRDIVQGIKKISQGIYNFDINVKGPKALKRIADDLKNIQHGVKQSVDKAVKSERMKAELITNVSHDLKTPLTSIISYVDLLSQDNITEEQRKKYLDILKDKSDRLKVLIEDLFEVSKASSGSVELHMVNLDPVALLRQTLGEFQDKIENSNLKIIRKFPEEKVTVYADGRKTFRVFQNLISNIFKYSMDGSRVYIEVSDEDEYVEVIFKNTSREELNFTEEEILQRFKRGDVSRSTEGSGLGLAIAKSLIEVQNGEFSLKIDGDLFKVEVKLRKGI